MRQYTRIELQKIAQDYISDMSITDISIKYNRTERAIRAMLSRRKLRRPDSSGYNEFTTKELQELFEQYEEGVPVEKLSEQYGHPVQYIRNVCHKNNIRRKKHYHRYMYAIVQADETEIPLTPYVDTIGELSKLSGIPLGTLYSASCRNSKVRYKSGRKLVWGRVSKVAK